MNVLSLFAGIGGLDLGLERAGMTVVGQVEIDPYCQRVLAKHWPEVPRHDDVRTATDWWLDGTPRPAVDVIAGGFPCQDISNAGRQAGIDGERSGLWRPMRDTIRDLRSPFVFLENVAALLVRGLDVVAGDLAAIGYDARWDCVPASAVGAPHRRDRWWCVAADANRLGRRDEPVAESGGSGPAVARPHGETRPLADPTGDGRRAGRPGRPSGRGSNRADLPTERVANADRQRCDQRARTRGDGAGQSNPAHCGAVAHPDRAGLDPWGWLGRPWPTPVRDRWWTPEPGMGGTDDGVPAGLDRSRVEPWERGTPRLATDVPNRAARLSALGNAVVPQVAEHVGRILLAAAGAA